MNALARGIALLMALIAWVTSQSIEANDESVHLHAVTEIMETLRKIEPLSCWCENTTNTDIICPVRLSKSPLDKDPGIFCGSQIHCCLEREVKQEDELTDLNPVNILNERDELTDLLTKYTRYAMPRKALKKHNISDVYNSILQNHFDKFMETHNLLENEYDTQNTDKNDENPSILNFLGQLFIDLGNFFIGPAHHLNKRSTRNKTIEEKAAALIIGFINSTFFQNNKLKTPEPHHNKTNLYESTNSTDTDLEKIDNPYARLGWFSRAVETAIDGSVYVGSAIGMMYVVSMFLGNLVNSVWSTCFMCYFIENFELVPINT